MNRKPLLARATFSARELTPEQIALVAGGEDGETIGECNNQNPAWTIEPTWNQNKSPPGDHKSVCTDWG